MNKENFGVKLNDLPREAQEDVIMEFLICNFGIIRQCLYDRIINVNYLRLTLTLE